MKENLFKKRKSFDENFFDETCTLRNNPQSLFKKKKLIILICIRVI